MGKFTPICTHVFQIVFRSDTENVCIFIFFIVCFIGAKATQCSYLGAEGVRQENSGCLQTDSFTILISSGEMTMVSLTILNNVPSDRLDL